MYRRMSARLHFSSLFRYLPPVLALLHFLIFLCARGDTVERVQATQTHRLRELRVYMFGWKKTGEARAVTSVFKFVIKAAMCGAAAFVIISIFVAVVALILLVLDAFDVFKKPLVVLIVDGMMCLTILFSWRCVAGAYNQGTCVTLPHGSVGHRHDYAAPFGLTVTVWVFELAAIVCFLRRRDKGKGVGGGVMGPPQSGGGT